LPTAAVDAALVLMADHELATSTMAVRLAASVRSDPYDALLALRGCLSDVKEDVEGWMMEERRKERKREDSKYEGML